MENQKHNLQTSLQDKALETIGNRSKISVEIGTGGGKTLLALRHMADRYTESISYCVAAPKRSIFKSWTDDINKFGYQYLLDHITFTTYLSLHKQSFNHDWLYLDECHSLKFSHSNWLHEFTLHKGKILGLTGTYPKDNEEKEIMCDKFCKKVFEYNVDTAITAGMLNDYKIYIHKLQLNTIPTLIKKKKNGKTWMTSEYKDYMYWNRTIQDANDPQKLRILRMKALQGYDTKTQYVKAILNKISSKTLIFANTKKQADMICKHAVYTGNLKSEENLKLFSEDKLYRLVCIDQLSEGVSINNLQVGIIMHSFSNQRRTKQRIGRFLRLSTNKTAVIHILCYENTVDDHWVSNALSSFDKRKIKIYRPNDT